MNRKNGGSALCKCFRHIPEEQLTINHLLFEKID